MSSPLKSPFRRILIGALFFFITITVAVVGYIIAGWTLLDAIYMVVITIFGVGYGEVNPLETTSLRVFTILVIIAGALSVAYIVTGFVQLVTEGEVRRALNLRQMTKEIKTLSNHVIVCGYGRVGQMLTQKLKADGQRFIVLDREARRINEAQENGYLVYLGNAVDEVQLRAVGIDRARALATVLPDDAANVFISLTARELNPQLRIVARGTMPSAEKKLNLAGAAEVILPASSHPNAVNFLAQNDGRANLNELLGEIDIQMNELEVRPNSPLAGRSIRDVELRGKGTFIIVALKRSGGEVIVHPESHHQLHPGDALIIMGHQEDMPPFAQRHAAKNQLRYRGAQVK